MPEFFVPHAESAEQAEKVWKATKKFLEQDGGYRVTERRLYAVNYSHNGRKYRDVVGGLSQLAGEEVLVILEDSNVFLICTKNRGVLRGGPVMAGRHWDAQETEFDALPAGDAPPSTDRPTESK